VPQEASSRLAKKTRMTPDIGRMSKLLS